MGKSHLCDSWLSCRNISQTQSRLQSKHCTWRASEHSVLLWRHCWRLLFAATEAGGHQPLESNQLTEEMKRLLMDPECDAEASTAPGKLTNKAHNRGLARRICCVKPLEAKKELNQTHQNSNHVTGRKQTESSKAEIVLDMVRQHTNRCACEFNGGSECLDQIPSVPKGASTFDFNLRWQQLLHATNPTALHGAFALVACVGPSGSSKRSALDRLCDGMCVAPLLGGAVHA